MIRLKLFSRNNRPILERGLDRLIRFSLIWLIGLSVWGMAAALPAQQINVQLSDDQVYVGQALTMEIQISQAEEVREPVLPEIEGVTVEKVGTPSRRIVTTIINNRRSQTQSLTYYFRLIPRQAGEYQIPGFTITVDGKKFEVAVQRFQALNSETGDLLFAEIESPVSEVYVGQPVPLTLKIWLAPFTDQERKIRLTERDMWQLLGGQKNWGIFGKRVEELAEKRQRPAGNLVYRELSDGTSGAYYLYEIETSFYPQRPGPLNVPELTVAGEYPTRLGRSRGLGSVFEEDGWSGFDRLFGESPFRSDRLAITATRPISVIAKSPAVEVIDIPSSGRPEDYRGAVGQYRIMAKASSKEVKAGDPVNLQLLIQGDGPMDSLPGPCLTRHQPLTDNFLVTEDPAAGIVQDESKLFWTTIRPRHAGISEIPPLPFSFFDPQTREFKTVYSQSIPLKVLPGEALSLESLDSIASVPSGGLNDNPVGSGNSLSEADWKRDLLLDQYASAEILAWRPAKKIWNWLWLAPPVGFLLWLGILHRHWIFSMIPGLEKPNWLAELRRATNCGDLARIIERHGGTPLPDDLHGIHQKCLKAAYGGGIGESFSDLRTGLEKSLRAHDRASSTLPTRSLTPSRLARIFLAGVGFCFLSAAAPEKPAGDDLAVTSPRLTDAQRQQMLEEAERWLKPTLGDRTEPGNQSPNPGSDRASSGSAAVPSELSATDSGNGQGLNAESKTPNLSTVEQRTEPRTRLDQGIELYRSIVSSGFKNPRLLNNLGNAYLAAGELPLATASFEDGWRLDPDDYRLLRKLKMAKSKLRDPELTSSASLPWHQRLLEANQWIPTRLSRPGAWGIWVIGWLWLATRVASPVSRRSASASIFSFSPNDGDRGIQGGRRHWIWKPALALLGLAMSVSWQLNSRWDLLYDGVSLSDGVSVYSADDDSFPVIGRLTVYQPIRQVAQRGGWTKLSPLQEDYSGWVSSGEIYSFR